MENASPKPRFGVQFMHIRERILPVRRSYLKIAVIASALGVFALVVGEKQADLGLGAVLLSIGAGLGFVYRRLYVAPAFWTRITAWVVTAMVCLSLASVLWSGELSLISVRGLIDVVGAIVLCTALWESVLTPEMEACIAQNEEEWRTYITNR